MIKKCSKCKTTSKLVTYIVIRKQRTKRDKDLYYCNPCNSKRFNEYYHTPKGKKAVLKANKKYESRK